MKLLAYLFVLVLFCSAAVADFTYELGFNGEITVQGDDAKGLSTRLFIEEDGSQEITGHSGDFSLQEDFVAEWGDVRDGESITYEMNFTIEKGILWSREGSYRSAHIGFDERIRSDYRLEGLSAQFEGSNSFETVYNTAVYMDKNIKRGSFSGTSTEVFSRREGDTASRVALFASFLRLRGIPTQIVYGLAGEDHLNPHIWTEAYLGEWIPVDIEMFQVGYVDHTHIALHRSDSISTKIAESTAKDIGDAKIKTTDLDFSSELIEDDRVGKTVMTETRILDGEPFSIIEIILENTGSHPYAGKIQLHDDDLEKVMPKTQYIYLKPEEKRAYSFQAKVKGRNISYYREAYLRKPISLDITVRNNMTEEQAASLKDIHIIDTNAKDSDIEAALNRSFSPEEIADMIDANKKTMENIVMQKFTVHDNETNKTKVVVRIKPKKGMKNVSIYESIPKCLAEQIKEIDTDQSFTIIEDDPLILWQFNELDQPIEISYEVMQAIRDTDCEDRSLTIAIAEQLSGEKVSHSLAIYSIIISTVVVLFAGHVMIRP